MSCGHFCVLGWNDSTVGKSCTWLVQFNPWQSICLPNLQQTQKNQTEQYEVYVKDRQTLEKR